jgi:hypothetical protein
MGTRKLREELEAEAERSEPILLLTERPLSGFENELCV